MKYWVAAMALVIALAARSYGQDSTRPAAAEHSTTAEHPAFFLVGDSIVKTGTGNGEHGPWGWGYEFIPLVDATKLHVYNEARGGRSSRSYIEEGAWAKVLAQVQAGDFVLLEFGNNDSANSKAYPDRTTMKGSDDQTQEIDSPVTHQKEAIHTYGWYMRQYVKDIKAKGATAIICSPPPRNTWVDGKIVRGMDGYTKWASEAAKASGADFVDLNSVAADAYDGLGQAAAAKDFNDKQHTVKAGAVLHARSVVAGLRALKDLNFETYLTDQGKAIPATNAKDVSVNTPPG